VVPKNNPLFGKVQLGWQRSSFGKVVGYRIYRKIAGSTAPFALIGTSATPMFIDTTNLKKIAYTYRVNALYDEQLPQPVEGGGSPFFSITIQ
jgi:hypothetical protein